MLSSNRKLQIANRKSQRSQISNLRFLALLLSFLPACTTLPATDPPASPTPQSTSPDSNSGDYSIIPRTLGRSGTLHDNVYTVTIPRTDLPVSIEGMDVPAAAGLASVFNFYQCSCGKSVVIGQFLCADYEANDVMNALQQADILVSAISPYLIYEKPRLLCIRFQSEGDAQKQCEALKTALSWTAKHTEPPRK